MGVAISVMFPLRGVAIIHIPVMHYGQEVRSNFRRPIFSSFLSAIKGELAHLPVVDSAVTSLEGVALGILQSVQDGFVFGAEVNSNHLVDLVDHFGGSGVFRGGFGVFASCSLDTAQFFFGSRSEHDEAHATTEVSLGKGGFFA